MKYICAAIYLAAYNNAFGVNVVILELKLLGGI